MSASTCGRTKLNFNIGTVSMSYSKKEILCFSFDFMSGYHHYENFQEHVEFLGFSRDFGSGTRFFSIQVLPIGSATAPYALTVSNLLLILGEGEVIPLFCI